MTETVRTESINIARAEIRKRIERIDAINSRFRSSYSDYTDRTGEQKALAVVLALVTLILLFLSPAIIRGVCDLVGTASSSPQGTMGLIALYTICLYAALIMWKVLIRLSHISKIDGLIAETTEIKTSLSRASDDLEKTFGDISKNISAKNAVITPVCDYDGRIDQYQRIAEAYHAEGSTALDRAIKAFYWITSIAFTSAFVALTADTTAWSVCDVFDADVYGAVIVAYMIVSIVAFVWVNIELHKHSKGIAASFFSSIACGPAGIAATWVICGAIAIVIYALVIIIVLAIIAGIIGAMAGS